MATLTSLSAMPTLSQLYKLGRLMPMSTSTASPDTKYNSMISTIRTDITKLQVDAIVNAANETLLGGGGVDGAIHRAAGRQLVEECDKLGGCKTGNSKITDAYKLPCKKVIHTVGPVYGSERSDSLGGHEKLLRGCYRTSLELAVKHKLTSIAFSAISTGVYGYPSREAAETAISEVKKFLDEGKGGVLERIVFCNFMEKDEKAYDEVLP